MVRYRGRDRWRSRGKSVNGKVDIGPGLRLRYVQGINGNIAVTLKQSTMAAWHQRHHGNIELRLNDSVNASLEHTYDGSVSFRFAECDRDKSLHGRYSAQIAAAAIQSTSGNNGTFVDAMMTASTTVDQARAKVDPT